MKKIFLSLALACGIVSAHATGAYQLNSPQSGTITFGTNFFSTNSFAPSFTYPPVMQFFASATNALPITNNFVTTTNFSISTASSNVVVTWTAQQGATLIEYGTATNAAAATGVNVTFPTPFAYPPQVFLQGSLTNVTAVEGVQSVTYTNFTYSDNIATTNSWMAIGTAANAGTTTVTH